MYRRAISPLALMACAFLAACGGGGGSSCESPPDIAGPWSGTINDSAAGSGRLSVSFDQSQCSLGGSWQTAFAAPDASGSGTVTGDADGSSVSFTLVTKTPGACGYQATGALQGSDEISASFATVGSNCASNGNLDILRQSTVTPTAMPTATPSP